jgi:hypothetical protein
MEPGENRSDSGKGPRIVRVGTHAVTATSRTTLWRRLSQHKGQVKSGGGDHRGSIFRLLVGSTLIDATNPCATWGHKSSAPRDIRKAEEALEQRVSAIIGDMPFLWFGVDDEPSTQSLRGRIERNAIALLSNLNKPALDPASAVWRGRACVRGDALVRDSGLWNQRHVNADYDPSFLDVMEKLTG